MNVTKLSLETNIELHPLIGAPISLLIQEILWDADQPSCLMIGSIEPDQWPRIWADGLFHLGPEVAVHDVAEFEEDEVITLELALDKAVLRSLLTHPEPIETLLNGLGGTTAESAYLLQSASWRACSVMQNIAVPGDPDATLQIGFQTVWAENNLDF